MQELRPSETRNRCGRLYGKCLRIETTLPLLSVLFLSEGYQTLRALVQLGKLLGIKPQTKLSEHL